MFEYLDFVYNITYAFLIDYLLFIVKNPYYLYFFSCDA